MDIGITVFAYNRSRHLKEVLEGLRKNEGVAKLYIFQDGLKCAEHRDEWEKTRRAIEGIGWCEVAYELSPYNKGLAASVVDGINAVFRENDAVIALEDDCVPAANFISFMKQCFGKYWNDKRIHSVSGYSWPIDLQEDEYDIYGCGRISSWGWGTWKDRWVQYSADNNILSRLKNDGDKSRRLAAWGSDLEQTVIGNIKGQADSWAVYWALRVIENGGICINPHKSLIRNMGMDGTGVHCGRTDRYDVEMDAGERSCFRLPDVLSILPAAERAFAGLHGNYTAASAADDSKENVLVYGLGQFFAANERELNDMYNIKAFIDRNKKGWFAGRKIISIDAVSSYEYDRIIVMIQKFQECENVFRALTDAGAAAEKIVMGHGCMKIDGSRTLEKGQGV